MKCTQRAIDETSKSFLDGMMRACDEGDCVRGAMANGLRIGTICSIDDGVNDGAKKIPTSPSGPVG
jgi:hypothetical protein